MTNTGAYRRLLLCRPDLGDLIKGAGGIRKARWRQQGKGKSGGIRVIYYWVTSDEQIRMLYAYPKSKWDTLTDTQIAQLKAVIERW